MNDLAVIEQNAISVAFQSKNGVDELFERLAKEARSLVPDLSTKKGRDAIASTAFKVSKAKTLVDSFGKDLVAEEKKRLKLIDDDRKTFRDKCDALRDEIRQPLTDWENAEAERIAKHEKAIAEIRSTVVFIDTNNSNADWIAETIAEINALAIDDSWEEFKLQAMVAKDETLKTLRQKLELRQKQEAEQAELLRLRQEAAERERIAHEQRIAEQAAAKARAEAEAKAEAEKQAMLKATQDAEREQARLIAEAEASRLREEAAKQAAIDAAKQAEIDKQAAIEAERLRIEREEQQRKAQAEREEQQRIANQNHVRKINREALSALMAGGDITEEQGKAIIKLIAARKIPNVTIQY